MTWFQFPQIPQYYLSLRWLLILNITLQLPALENKIVMVLCYETFKTLLYLLIWLQLKLVVWATLHQRQYLSLVKFATYRKELCVQCFNKLLKQQSLALIEFLMQDSLHLGTLSNYWTNICIAFYCVLHVLVFVCVCSFLFVYALLGLLAIYSLVTLSCLNYYGVIIIVVKQQ